MILQKCLLRGENNLEHHQFTSDNSGSDSVKRVQLLLPSFLSLHERRDPRPWYDQAALLIPRQRNDICECLQATRGPPSLRVPGSQRMRMLLSAATAAARPATTKMVQSCLPFAPRMTSLEACCSSLTRLLTGRRCFGL